MTIDNNEHLNTPHAVPESSLKVDMVAIERHKKQQKENMAAFVKGGTDGIGNKIVRIFAKADEYVIYEIANSPVHESIKVYIDTIDEEDETPILRYNAIKPHFDEFIATVCKFAADDSYKKRASSAITMALHGAHDDAVALFKSIKNDAETEHTEKVKGRLSYQGGTFTLSSLMCLIASTSYFLRDLSFIENNPVFFEMLLVAAAASMGGVLSVSLNIRELTIDRGLGRVAYFMHGAERIFISVIGGFFLYILIKANLAFGILGMGDSSFFGILAVSLLAGFSETLVPNALKNLEKDSAQT